MIRRHMTILASFLAFLPASAWAQGEPAPVVENFTVVDQRVDAEKKQKILSLIITSCDYGVYRLGDKKAPGRFDALHDDLARLKGAALAGKSLQVSRYNIYFNNAATLRGMVGAQYQGVLMDWLKEKGTHCPREKTSGGWFDASELTAPFPPLIVDLETTLDGVSRTVRVVHTPSLVTMGAFKKPEEQAEVTAAMRKAAEALAAQLL